MSFSNIIYDRRTCNVEQEKTRALIKLKSKQTDVCLYFIIGYSFQKWDRSAKKVKELEKILGRH